MRRAFAVLAVLILAVVPISIAESDGSDPEIQKIRWSENTLYHFVGTARHSGELNGWLYDEMGLFVYPLGQDSSMEAYITNPQKNTPERGLNRIVEGVQYDVYSTSTDLWDFNYSGYDVVKSKYEYTIHVREKTVDNLNVVKLKVGGKDTDYYRLVYNGTEKTTKYADTGVWYTLNHQEDSGYYSLFCYDSTGVYIEAEIQLVVKEFQGSPYLYIGLCIVITALVAISIAICGRKPNL